jgi:hypothetical protein
MMSRVLRVMLLSFFLTLVLSLSAEAWGRAGGGGSRSSSYSSSRSSSGRLDGMGALVDLGFKVLLPLGALLHIALVNRRINRRRKEISNALEMMSQREPEWSETKLSALVHEKVILLQKAWSEQNLDSIKEQLHPELYPYWESQINSFKAKKIKNEIENFQIKDIRFVALGNFLINEHDRFTVCVDGKCVDHWVSIESSESFVFRGSSEQKTVLKVARKFREFWTFEREKNTWKLIEVSQFAAWSRFVNSDIVYELKNRPRPRFDIAYRAPRLNEQKEIGIAKILLPAMILPVVLILFSMGPSSQFVDFNSAAVKFLWLALPISYFLFYSIKRWLYEKLDSFDAEQMPFGIATTAVLVCCFTISAVTLKLVNKYLDWSEDLVIQDTVLDKNLDRRRSSRGGRIIETYSVGVIPPLDKVCCSGGSDLLQFAVKEDVFSSTKVGRTEYRLVVKRGLLGIPWVSQFEIIPETLAKPERQSRFEGKNLSAKALDDVRNWNPEAPKNLTTNFRITNWRNGAMKSKEPMLSEQVHGVATFRFENGQLYGEIPFYRGQKNGRFKLYRENGSLDQELSYKKGRLHGVCRWYDKKGKLKQEELYLDGELIR